jgi:hypothetical protein
MFRKSPLTEKLANLMNFHQDILTLTAVPEFLLTSKKSQRKLSLRHLGKKNKALAGHTLSLVISSQEIALSQSLVWKVRIISL